MKIMSINMHNLYGRAKNISPRRFSKVYHLDIILIQEMMGRCDNFIPELEKLLPG